MCIKLQVGTSLFHIHYFSHACHNRSEAWHVLGCIPDFDLISSAYRTNQHLYPLGKGRSCHNYHTCLSKILKSFIDCQEEKATICMDLYWRKSAILPCFLAFMIGDSLSHDKMCGPQIILDFAVHVVYHPKKVKSYFCKFLDMDCINQECENAMRLYNLHDFKDNKNI